MQKTNPILCMVGCAGCTWWALVSARTPDCSHSLFPCTWPSTSAPVALSRAPIALSRACQSTKHEQQQLVRHCLACHTHWWRPCLWWICTPTAAVSFYAGTPVVVLTPDTSSLGGGVGYSRLWPSALQQLVGGDYRSNHVLCSFSFLHVV